MGVPGSTVKFCTGRLLTAVILLFLGSSCNRASQDSKRVSAPPAQSAKDHSPKLCLAWNPDTELFGWNSWEERSEQFCPINHAIYALDDQPSGSGPIQYSYFAANCCPLPANDILTTETILVYDRCPENYIITGSVYQPTMTSRPITSVRCTKINTARYRLGPSRTGVYWGVGSGIHSYSEKQPIKISDVPAAIRSSIGRTGFSGWDTDGCIGSPPGSLITKRSVSPCSGSEFRELLFRGIGDDPVDGTRVKMFPDCARISDIFDQNAICINDFEPSTVKEH